ncbi:MAG: CoA transferase [Bacteroidia bacterium]|nr:CoA transferase [Bacteroidia bacterium]
MVKPLENIKVLDLTRVLAGPFCTMILNDLGAEVVKVEIPGTGDDSRQFGPFLNGRSLYFLSLNREKKSISIDLKSDKGQDIFINLVKKTDIIVENYRPGTMEGLGLGYDKLREINRGIIYAAISGYGHTGPESGKPSYDILAQAGGGIMSITGWPGTRPTRAGISLGDITAALYTTIGITTALYQRQITGVGQKIDVSMLDCQVAILENALVRYQIDNKPPQPAGNRHPAITPFEDFKATDGYFVIAVGNNELWKTFCNVISKPNLANDSRFNSNAKRTENVKELERILSDIFITDTVEYWISLFNDAGIPCSPINTIDKLFINEQLVARNMIVEIIDKFAGNIKLAGNPIKMTNLPDEKHRKTAPDIGQHNSEIFKTWLNL